MYLCVWQLLFYLQFYLPQQHLRHLTVMLNLLSFFYSAYLTNIINILYPRMIPTHIHKNWQTHFLFDFYSFLLQSLHLIHLLMMMLMIPMLKLGPSLEPFFFLSFRLLQATADPILRVLHSLHSQWSFCLLYLLPLTVLFLFDYPIYHFSFDIYLLSFFFFLR